MWTAKGLSLTINDGGYDCTFVYQVTDGKQVLEIVEPRVANLRSCVPIMIKMVDFRNKQEAQKDAIAAFDIKSVLGDLDTILSAQTVPPLDAPPIAQKVPTQDELDSVAYLKNIIALQKSLNEQKAIQDGLASSDASIQALAQAASDLAVAAKVATPITPATVNAIKEG